MIYFYVKGIDPAASYGSGINFKTTEHAVIKQDGLKPAKKAQTRSCISLTPD